jgi:hypothetical protein
MNTAKNLGKLVTRRTENCVLRVSSLQLPVPKISIILNIITLRDVKWLEKRRVITPSKEQIHENEAQWGKPNQNRVHEKYAKAINGS